MKRIDQMKNMKNQSWFTIRGILIDEEDQKGRINSDSSTLTNTVVKTQHDFLCGSGDVAIYEKGTRSNSQ
jgi:hypothetical protein